MVTLTPPQGQLRRAVARVRGVRTLSSAWLLLAGGYFVLPLIATAIFSVKDRNGLSLEAYAGILADPEFRATLSLSLRLSVETVAISLLLFVPTVFWLHVRFPKVRRVVEMVTLVPLVVPPTVLIVGLLHAYGNGPDMIVGRPEFLVAGYVVLSFPFMYRSLDAAFRALDVRTLNDAGMSLGARPHHVLLHVILPNIRMGALSGALITFAVVMGEFAMANIALFNTFPVYINYVGETQAAGAAALSVLSFAITWAAMAGVLVVGRRRSRAKPSGLTIVR